jgi:hypothetical protein
MQVSLFPADCAFYLLPELYYNDLFGKAQCLVQPRNLCQGEVVTKVNYKGGFLSIFCCFGFFERESHYVAQTGLNS